MYLHLPCVTLRLLITLSLKSVFCTQWSSSDKPLLENKIKFRCLNSVLSPIKWLYMLMNKTNFSAYIYSE